MKLVCLLLGLALALFARPVLAETAQPSFDCAKASTRIERTICSNPALAADDATMARLYAPARVSAFGSGPSNVPSSQRQWLKERNACARPDSSVWGSVGECLAAYNRDRLEVLAVAALFHAPDLALPVLRKVDPEAAPMYEAILLWSSAPQGGEPKQRIIALLAPYFTLLDPDGNERQGAAMLAGYDLPDAAAATGSDEAFARFLKIASVHLQDGPTPHLLPCAAIVNRPALLDAMGPEFGATMDNFIIYPDCEDTLPPMPALSALERSIFAAWPDCDGSMRFLFYRGHARDTMAARLGLDAGGAAPGRARAPGATPTLVAAAESELAAIYRDYRMPDAAGARALARRNLAAMVASAGVCDGMEEDG